MNTKAINRRNILKATGALAGIAALGVATQALGKNDQKIIDTIKKQKGLFQQFFAFEEPDGHPVAERLYEDATSLDDVIAEIPSDSWAGVRAKVEWLKHPDNYNLGGFGGDWGNGRVLLSMFEDVLSLTNKGTL